MITLAYLLTAIHAVLQYWDIQTTRKAMKLGFTESNPVVVKFMEWFGDYWWIPKALQVVGAIALAIYFPLIIFYALIPVNLLYGYVVYRNLKTLGKRRF